MTTRHTVEKREIYSQLKFLTCFHGIFLLFQVFVIFDLFWYCSNVCLDICNATGWYLFKINYTPSEPSNSKATNNTSKKHRWTIFRAKLLHYYLASLVVKKKEKIKFVIILKKKNKSVLYTILEGNKSRIKHCVWQEFFPIA